MPRYEDRENMPDLIEPGEYMFKVLAIELGISAGAKTVGSDKFDLKLAIPAKGGYVMYDALIDHDCISWRIDTFVKSCGIKIAKGQTFSFVKEDTGVPGEHCPVGCFGWCVVRVSEFTTKTGGKKSKNEIAVYLTDRAKIAREVPVVAPESQSAHAEGEEDPF